MRLTKIKLAGFKSFVDPTTVPIPGNLMAIVGPNGCGKSNIIDAVRWVMGESSARSLRGESLADVIFNGSATRKPVGQAVIELVFDNGQGELAGPWAQYNEIAIKRVLSRDGQSSYFINGIRCRRKDITDLFLGTGLGPRSYAIIEQGMISRLIDARPEEVRSFLEEAAGISKYKERRQETETRIRHTRENLERLADLREELGKQLEHLQHQARLAEQYRQYRAEERQLKAELLAMRWQAQNAEHTIRERQIREQETALEGKLAEQRRLELQAETEREQQLALNEIFSRIQEQYFALGEEIARLEQRQEHQRELCRRHQAELREAEQQLAGVAEQIRADAERLEALQSTLAETEQALAQARASEAASNQQVAEAEGDLQDWQVHWEALNRQISEPQRRVAVERTGIAHLERQLSQRQQRVERLAQERESLTTGDLEAEIERLQVAERQFESTLAAQQAEIQRIEARIAGLRESLSHTTEQANDCRERMQSRQGQLASLKTLQEAALGQGQGGVNDWLRALGLGEAPRLASQLRVEEGWERAVETTLGNYLEAVCIPDLDNTKAALAELTNGFLTLLESSSYAAEAVPERALASKIKLPPSLNGLLAGVVIAADLEEALLRRRELADGESLVTPEGIRVGRHWLQVIRGDGDKAGVLTREREIRSLEGAMARDAETLECFTIRLEQSASELSALEGELNHLRDALHQARQEQIRLQGQSHVAATRLQHVRNRRANVEEEIEDLQQQLEHDRLELLQARERLEENASALSNLTEEQRILAARRDGLRNIVQERRSTVGNATQAVQRQALALEALRSQLTSGGAALDRLSAQREQLLTRCQGLAASLATTDEADIGESLQVLLQGRIEAERQLTEARQDLEAKNTALLDLERQRSVNQRELQAGREALEAQRLACRELGVHRQTLLEQLQELAAEPEAVLANLPADPNEQRWQGRLERVAQRIQRLGAVNLAAIEECAQLTERKRYLDAQHEDLMEALGTLEGAMRKIDRETRSRFKETFECANDNFKRLFPRLFGGGQAYLELASEELLEAGVAIMARPPGKRNGTIHLLSGGEKALTAVALIFALFQLSPTPFCLLDEVDAPLDDVNISRFGELLREMSDRVQFLFITHNKITMELAQHLSGVTMQEPGVSRLVAVDVEAALRLATAV